ncbi:argininosuccinate lyase [Arenicella xantha]|uniref:Argininosuccinate lyase n=1 Tax=Arenicella xantha TaxID=644221 RepID=A0A395JP61_9GAMM|nr:argininosuccinate lyase [Arenicella xantha]RBP53440.1 argininosuccinate lyase [Arenicella xantha]
MVNQKTTDVNPKATSKKPWGGRFTEATNALVEAFTESVSFDARLYRQDIQGSLAHSKMLAKIGIITNQEAEQIHAGLHRIRDQIDAGEFEWSTELEDVHMNIEARLTEDIGDAGKKLHTGRSRNDQVATDIRLYMREASDDVIDLIRALQHNLLTLAENEVDTILPGFTHLQVAQPISLAHHLLAWNEMLERDAERITDCRKRINVMPLGSAALAGTSFDLDRDFTCELLGFDRPSRNSLDAVSDRDFMIEFASAASLVMMHLSRMCEEIILWASESYKFIDIGDAFCTGSSIMPQKKNPDIAEIVRGKSARVFGNLHALLVLMKSQPLAYNRDNQEDKEPIFDTIDTVARSLQVFAAMIPSITFRRDRMEQAALKGYATATDLAEYLVRLQVPFRDAHEIVGGTVHYAIEQNKPLSDLTLAELQSFGSMIQDDVYDVLTLEGSVNARSHFGGTAPARVREALQAAQDRLTPPK